MDRVRAAPRRLVGRELGPRGARAGDAKCKTRLAACNGNPLCAERRVVQLKTLSRDQAMLVVLAWAAVVWLLVQLG